MLKTVFILLGSVFISCPCLSQNTSTQKQSKDAAVKSQNSSVIATVPAAETPSFEKVLFATNEDCELYIDEELKGTVLKTEFRYVSLMPGTYFYRARSKATGDDLKGSITVAKGKSNEIFMDVLYVVDEMNAERDSLRKRAGLALPMVLQQVDLVGYTDADLDQAGPPKDKEIAAINTIIGNMVFIKGGRFIMGNNRSAVPDEMEHPVTIKTFYISKYEISQRLWENIMGDNPSIYKDCANCPVENVSWEDVMKFIRKLNVVSGKKFRLPTEAEWEYVATLGGKMEIDTSGGEVAYIKRTAWNYTNSAKITHPVGGLLPNAGGVYDLFGNVSEWCSDWYGADYYKEEFNRVNPEGPPLGKEKIVRGGNFKEYTGDHFRPSMRVKRVPTYKGSELGFRLVMELN